MQALKYFNYDNFDFDKINCYLMLKKENYKYKCFYLVIFKGLEIECILPFLLIKVCKIYYFDFKQVIIFFKV